MGTLRPINPHTASLIANPQATAHDYDNLTHKPQINGHELSGDQSGSDLGLQNQLTAGDNVTIDENGVISVEGGTDDYNDLENKPTINGDVISGDIQIPLPYLYYYRMGDGRYYLNIQEENVFHSCAGGTFSFIHSDARSAFSGLNPQNRRYPDEYPTDDNGILFRLQNRYYDDSHRITFVEPNYFFFSSVENAIYLRTDHYTYPDDVFVKGEWRKIGGGSQIVSGVVNQNGTITFTDSDGNTFTTSGSSVIGADGVGIADVHIDGGGDLIIEYTTGHMENVGHVVGADGQDYVLTAQDKSDIANIVLQLLPTTEGVLYGN